MAGSVLTCAEAASPAGSAVARGQLTVPNSTIRLLGHVARIRKLCSKARQKYLRNSFGQFFAKVNIEVTRGH